MSIGFLALFKRGRFGGRRRSAPNQEADQLDETRERQERERFAMACLGFCLIHDSSFGARFIEIVSHLFAENPTAADEFHVEVEPQNSCDLLVRIGAADYWIEGKICAALDDHQNPEKDCFHAPKGYGREIGDSPNRCRYIVLRQSKNVPSGVSPNITSGGVRYAYLSWHDFWPKCSDFSRVSSIYRDFLFSLGEIGIEEFRQGFAIMEAKKTSLTGDVVQGALAMQVLEAALESFNRQIGGGKNREITFDRWSENGKSGWSMGYALAAPKSGPLLWIRANSGDGGREIAWIGYAGGFDINSPVDREVWLYGPKSSDNVKVIKNKLRERRLDAAIDTSQEDGVLVVIRSVIKTPPVEQGVDLRWFREILGSLIEIGTARATTEVEG